MGNMFFLDAKDVEQLRWLLQMVRASGGRPAGRFVLPTNPAQPLTATGILCRIIDPPAGQPQLEDCRYYLQPQYANNSNGDEKAKLSLVNDDVAPRDKWIVATNLGELDTDTHDLPAGKFVYAMAVSTGGSNPYTLYWFDTAMSGGVCDPQDPSNTKQWIAVTSINLAGNSYNVRTYTYNRCTGSLTYTDASQSLGIENC